MLKQLVRGIKTVLSILFAVLFVVSITAASASAAHHRHHGGGHWHGGRGRGWGWGHDHWHHHWWHGYHYSNCDWVLNLYTNQWIWTC